jgi:hypothetical protein
MLGLHPSLRDTVIPARLEYAAPSIATPTPWTDCAPILTASIASPRTAIVQNSAFPSRKLF